MKWTLRCGTAVALFGLSAAAQAGLLGGLFSGHGRGSGCCEEQCCETACRQVVARPCEQTYTYQRKVSDLKPPCCDGACGDGCCTDGCCTAPCDAGCAPTDCCATGRGHRGIGRNLFKNLCKGLKGHGGLCGGHGVGCCEDGCGGECGPAMEPGDPCEIAKLIYKAQTACYADDREDAVDELGEFDCRCHPEIMVALLYSLNDADEDVRAQAADEIGDLLEEGRCCCTPEIVAALTCALGDCDDDVRDQAEEALEACGYDVVEGCCQEGCCETACTATGGAYAAPVAPVQQPPVPTTPAPAPMKKNAAPAPAPPEDPEAFFPSRYRKQTSRQNSLTNLFSLAN